MQNTGKIGSILRAALLLSIVTFGAGLLAQPTAPTSLFVDSEDAQFGTQGDPVVGLSRKPAFSAVFNHGTGGASVAEARVQIASDAAFANVVATTGWDPVTPSGPGTRISNVLYTGNALECNVRYWWRIRTRDNTAQTSPWSTEAASFQTVPCPHDATVLFVGSTEAQTGTQGDPVADVSLHAYFSAIVLHDSPTVAVTEARVQFAFDAAFTNIAGGTGWQPIAATLSGGRCPSIHYDANALLGSTRTWWRIRFRDTAGVTGPWSTEAASFVTLPAPNAASSLFVDSVNAQSGSQGNPVVGLDTTPVFSAVVSHQNANTPMTRFRIQVAADAEFSTVIWTGSRSAQSTLHGGRLPDAAYSGPPLQSGATYYWRCRTRDQNEFWGPWSVEPASFTVSGSPSPALTTTISGGYRAIPQGMSVVATVTKTGGTPFDANTSFLVSGVGVSVQVVSVNTADEATISFVASHRADAGPHTLTAYSGSTIIASGQVLVFLPSDRVFARIGTTAQEPVLGGAEVGYSVTGTGEFRFHLPLISIAGRVLPLEVSASYRSGLDINGIFGRQWTASFDDRCYYWPALDEVHFVSHNGRIDRFVLAPSGISGQGPYVCPGYYWEVSIETNEAGEPEDDIIRIITSDRSTLVYEVVSLDTANVPVFRRTSASDRNGNTVRQVYNGLGQLVEIRGDLHDASEPSRHRLLLTYGQDGRVSSITDFADYAVTAHGSDIIGAHTGARQWHLLYDSEGRLTEVRLPAVNGWDEDSPGPNGRARLVFGYLSGPSGSTLLGALYPSSQASAQLVSSSGIPWLRNHYDASERVASQDFGADSISDTGHRQHLVYGPSSIDFVDATGRRMRHELDSTFRPITRQVFTGFFNATLAQTAPKVRSSDPASFADVYAYNVHGELTQHVKPRGNVEAWHYDVTSASQRAHGNLLRRAMLPGSVSTGTLPSGQQHGLLWTFTYDSAFNQLTSSVDPRAYDLNGSFDISTGSGIARNDAGSFTTTWQLDGTGNPISMTGPVVVASFSPSCPHIGQQHERTYQYNSFGQLTRESDDSDYSGTGSTGSIVSYVYGTAGFGRGRLVRTIASPESSPFTTEYEYNSIGEQVLVRNNANATWITVVDQLGRVRRTLGPAMAHLEGARYQTDRSFDLDGNETETATTEPIISDTGGLTGSSRRVRTAREFGPLGTLRVAVQDVRTGHSRQTAYGYDAAYRVLNEVSSAGTKSAMSYDERGLVHIEYIGLHAGEADLNQALAKVHRNYDANENATEVVDPRGFVRPTTFDAYDRVASVQDARLTPSVTTYIYNHSGQLIASEIVGALENANVPGQPTGLLARTEQLYDNAGRLYRQMRRAVKADGTTPLTLAGAPQGQLDDTVGWSVATSRLLPDARVFRTWSDVLDSGSTTTATPEQELEYDELQRLRSMSDAAGNRTVWAYNSAGHISMITEQPWSQYDDNSQTLAKHFQTDEQGRQVATWNEEDLRTSPTTICRYNAFDQPVYEHHNGKVHRHREYDLAGRVVSAKSSTPSTVVLIENYVKEVPEGQSFTTIYEYDDDDNLVAFTEPGNLAHARRYDLLSRHVQTVLPSGRKFTIGQQDSVAPIAGTLAYVVATGGYDAAGNALKVNDLGGNVLTRTYGPEGNLQTLQVLPINPDILLGERDATFVHDGLGRVVACQNTDHLMDVREKLQSWNSLDLVERHTTKLGSGVLKDTECTYDGQGRKQSYTNLVNGTVVSSQFDAVHRPVQTKVQGAIPRTSARTYLGRTSSVNGAVAGSTGTSAVSAYRVERDSGGRPRAIGDGPIGEEPNARLTRIEHCNCGSTLAEIRDRIPAETATRSTGTRYFQDPANRPMGNVRLASFPGYTGDPRSDQWELESASAGELSIRDSSGRVAQRAVFKGVKGEPPVEDAILWDADDVVALLYNADGFLNKVGDVDIELSEAAYPAVSCDGVYAYSHDHSGRLVRKARRSDGAVLESTSYDPLGAAVLPQFNHTLVTTLDFSTSNLEYLRLPPVNRDWQGGGLRFQSVGLSWLESYFPAHVRPRFASDGFQGGQRSYHDFLISPTLDAVVAFVDWNDNYRLELRITGLTAALFSHRIKFNQQTQQNETIETQLATFALTLPEFGTRMTALGVRLDIGATQNTNHQVLVSVWTNGSLRLDSHAVVMPDLNFAPNGIQFGTSQGGARIYRYNSYVEISQPPAGARHFVEAGAGKRGIQSALIGLEEPSGEILDQVAATGEYANWLEEDAMTRQYVLGALEGQVYSIRSSLQGQNFTEVSGYSELIARTYSDGLRGGSLACQQSLLDLTDKIENKFTAMRQQWQDIGAKEAIWKRLQQVDAQAEDYASSQQATVNEFFDPIGQVYSFNVHYENILGATDDAGVGPSDYPFGELLGAFPTGTLDTAALGFDFNQSPITPYYYVNFLISNSIGEIWLLHWTLIGFEYVPLQYKLTDFVPAGLLNAVLAQAEQRTRWLLEKFERESAEKRVQLAKLMDELEPMYDELDRQQKVLGFDIFELIKQLNKCNSIFEAEGLYAKLDGALSQILLALASAGTSTIGSGMSAGGRMAARQSLKQTAKETAGTGGLCFVAGTQVVVADENGGKSTRSIEAVQLGDLAWSRCDDTGAEGFRPVTHLFVTHPVELIHLSYRRESGSATQDPDSTLVGTRVHPFWSVDRAAWVDMGDLLVGERLRLLDGSFATVTRVQAEHAPCADPDWIPGAAAKGTHGTQADPHTGTFTTYNFEVAQWHTYFAAPVGSTSTHASAWVHNLNVGLCREGKELLRSLKNQGVTRAERRELLEAASKREQPLFGQRRVGETFGSGGPSHLAGRKISDVAADLRAGKLSPDDVPIEAFYHNGELVSANTRSLAALSEAGLKPTSIKIIQPTKVLLGRLKETPLIPNAPLPGPVVPVTPGRTSHTILRIITTPRG